MNSVTADDKVNSFDNGLLMRNDTTYEEWLNYGKSLSRQYSRCQFQVGDWINIGESLFGEKYAQALDDLMFAYGTLRNYASICARIPLEVRNPKLKFHQAKHVAPLERHEQKRLLDTAAEYNMTGDDILEAVNKILGKNRRNSDTLEGWVTGYDGKNLLVEIDAPLNSFQWKSGQTVTIKVK